MAVSLTVKVPIPHTLMKNVPTWRLMVTRRLLLDAGTVAGVTTVSGGLFRKPLRDASS